MAKRLLIVDDEETITFSLYQSFIHSKKDYEVVTAASGEEALERSRENPFDLVITDIMMPGMDGFDLMAALKQESPQTDVIIMTAYGSNMHKDRAISEGARSYIEKPFEMQEFKKMVIDILG